ncbi:MAG: O-antigen polymerase [Ignavibacteriaceae bacterium]|jgi:oligosaccharide repeat unit polymerase
MSILIVLVFSISTLVLSKYLFKKWFNHLLIYTLAWTVFLVLYELKFIRYIEISNEAFYIFFITQVGMISGALTVYFARNVFKENKTDMNGLRMHSVLFNDDFIILKAVIVFTSLVGFFSAYQTWTLLLEKFGNITTIILRANLIYRMRVAGELELGIPYISILPYAGVVFSGIYTAAKNKITFYTFLPITAIIIKDSATAGRGGVFVAMVMLGTSFFLFRHAVSKNPIAEVVSSTKKLVLGSVMLITIVVTCLVLVLEFRGRYEAFKGKTNVFNQVEGIPLMNASMYFYFSSNMGVFSKYYELQDENTMIGENTFLPFYNLIAKFDIVKKPNYYPKGYNIPSWSNAATYLKEIHADFGDVGLFLIPYLMSLLSAFYWYRFYEKGDMISFTCLVYLFTMNAFAVFDMLTRTAFFMMSFLFILLLIPVTEKYWNRSKQNSHQNHFLASEEI